MTDLLVTRDCAVPGCPDEAHKGHLCDYHTANPARVQADRFAKPAPLPVSPPQTEAKPKRAPRPTPQPKPKEESRSKIAPAITTGSLLQLATECDAAAASLTEARVRHETAVAALRAALDAIA